MTTRTIRRPLLLALACLAFVGVPAQAQVSLGADIVSRYVWRGIDFGDSWTIQPSVSFAGRGFEVGAWASYGVDGINENDLYVTYTFATESGTTFALGLNDYYFPDPTNPEAPEFFSTNAHAIEPFVSFSGPASFPLELSAGVVFAPVPEEPEPVVGGREKLDRQSTLYFEIGVPFSKGGADLRLHLGGVGGKSVFYGTKGGGIITTGISASKAIAVGESFEIPVTLSYILNPASEQSFLVFGLTLSP